MVSGSTSVKILAILNNSFKRTALWLAAVLVFPVLAFAHHSFEMFDVEKTVTLKGTVKEWQWTNPHCWIQLNVEQDGKVTEIGRAHV